MLEFSFGFLCSGTADEPKTTNETWARISKNWAKYTIGEFSIWADPRLPILRRGSNGSDVLILGDVFSLDARPVSTVVDELLGPDPWPVLDCLAGRFAVLIMSSGQCRVAHDAFGSRSVFYLGGNQFAVASHAALLAGAYSVARDERITAYMQRLEFRKRTVKYLPGDMTVYRNMYALIPNNYLDSNSNETRRYWPFEKMKRTTLEQFHVATDEYFAAFVPFVASKYKPIFGITGGVDSRAVYCAFRRYGVSFHGVTWGAGYLQRAEEPVIKAIVELLDIEHTYLDPRDYRSREAGAAAAINGGNFRGPSSLTEAMAARYGDQAAAVFVRGYGGEIMRGFYNLRAKPMQDLLPETLVGAYGSSIRGAKPGPDYKSACADFFDAFRERGNYEGLEAFEYDPNDIFYWEHRMGMWGAAMLNEMDPAVYSLVGFNSRRLYAATLSLDPQRRLKKKLLKDVISRNDKELGAIAYE